MQKSFLITNQILSGHMRAPLHCNPSMHRPRVFQHTSNIRRPTEINLHLDYHPHVKIYLISYLIER